MGAIVYSARSSLFSREITYGLDAADLSQSDGRVVALADIVHIRTYGQPGTRMFPGGQEVSKPFERCVIRLRHGPKIAFSSRSFLGPGRAEDRAPSYNRFVDRLVGEVRAANPDAVFIAGMPMPLWIFWLVLLVACAALGLVALMMLFGLAIERNTDVNEWGLGLAVLAGGLPGLGIPSLLREGWPRPYEPDAVSASL